MVGGLLCDHSASPPSLPQPSKRTCHFSLPVCALSIPASTFLLTVRVLHPSHFRSPTPKSPPASAQLQRDLFLIPQSSHCLLPAFHVHSLLSGPLQGPHTPGFEFRFLQDMSHLLQALCSGGSGCGQPIPAPLGVGSIAERSQKSWLHIPALPPLAVGSCSKYLNLSGHRFPQLQNEDSNSPVLLGRLSRSVTDPL